MQEHVHRELNQEIAAIGGHYVLVKEARLPFRGRDLLYVVGHGVVDASCCGSGGCAYALVPGLVVRWKEGTNKHGLAVSLVEPIGDKATRDEIRRLIAGREVVHQVRFL